MTKPGDPKPRPIVSRCHACGVRGPKAKLASLLQPFQPLLISFTSRGDAAQLARSIRSRIYTLPDETAALKPGPNLEVAQNNCTGCHSADYIQTQPRGPKFKKDFWQAEVTKMIKLYGAPIDEADVGKIVDYLAATY